MKIKKSHIAITLVLAVSLVTVLLPNYASAGWLQDNILASIFSSLSSFFQKIVSTASEAVQKIIPSKTTTITKESCVPSVSQKPTTGYQGKLGTLKISPEITHDATDGNSIVIHISTNTDVRSISLKSEIGSFGKNDILDWGSKDLPGKGFSGINISSGSFEWVAGKDVNTGEKLFLAKGDYWVKIKTKYSTNHTVKNNVGSYGWSGIWSVIQTDTKRSESKEYYYVGGKQKPDLVYTKVGNQTKGNSLNKPIELKSGESFEVQVTALSQEGTIHLISDNTPQSSLGAEVSPNLSINVKAHETATWRLTPIADYVMIQPTIENNCGTTALDGISIPIKFKKDEEKVTQPEERPLSIQKKENVQNVKVEKITIAADKVKPEIAEEETIVFSAKFVVSDGSIQSVTEKVTWGVIGDIGTVASNGFFKAKLGESVSEYGEGFGFVTATYKDESGKSLLGQSYLIKVKALVPNLPQSPTDFEG